MKQILFADNDVRFLKARSEFLEDAGYKVILATSFQEAERLLDEAHIHLAILDMRLINDRDKKDVSGLLLAQKDKYRQIPKIMHTRYPTYEAVREALGPAVEGLPPAVGFIAKQEGPEALISAVEKAFAQNVCVNWNLVIQHNEAHPIALSNLVTFLIPELGGEQLLNRTRELEDLFRRLFYSERQIKIDRLLWQCEGRVALSVFAFSERKAPESLVVICGQNSLVLEEAHHYKEFAPKAPGRIATVLSKSSETTYFAANGYTLANVDLENVHSIKELYRLGPEKVFYVALNNLFNKSLAEWHKNQYIPETSTSLDEIYRRRVGLTPQQIGPEAFEERVQYIVRQIPTIGTKIESESGMLTIRFDWQSYSYPDPTPILFQAFTISQPVLLMNTPGTLTGENILTDTSGQIWLTDFATAGAAPLLWNLISLEAAIRFDWMEKTQLQWLHDMEKVLVSNEFSNLYVGDVETSIRKPLRAMQKIRYLATRLMGKDTLPYHLGILFFAASRLAHINLASQLTLNEVTRLAHLLLAAAMICDKLSQEKKYSPVKVNSDITGIWIDKTDHAVWVNGIRISLRGKSYDLLCYLYEHANQLCTRREIIEQALRERYYEADESQIRRLNTAIHRLRERIDVHSQHSHYLLTEVGGGYRLVTQPKEQPQ